MGSEIAKESKLKEIVLRANIKWIDILIGLHSETNPERGKALSK